MTQPPVSGQPAQTGDEPVESSALLPRSLFKGEVKPGDTITLTVSAIYGDEVEAVVSQPTVTQEPPPMTADEEIEMMGGKV